MNEPEKILKKYWGYDAFRPLQLDIINSVLAGNATLALMPTGGGKSICFQVPGLLNEGLCLVISPLIALIKDQVANLKKKGIPALSIYSGMSFIEVKKTLQNARYGNFKFLYVSPERLESELFLEYLPNLKINLIAIDEAHCISQWGYDFRPSYLRIAALREYFPAVPFLALTASATLEVQNDIREKLLFRQAQKTFLQSFERANLSYSAFQLFSKENKLLTILNKVLGSGIVYCKTRRRTKEIAELLNLNGIVADHYHAGLTSDQRNKRQEDWINNKTRIIACTNAFGMGIDKPDVRTVVHYDVPEALENYYQEAGRAGRDGKKAFAVLLFNEAELKLLKEKVAIKFPSNEVIKKVYGALCDFLQLPSNSGEGFSYDFDLNIFAKNFKLDAYTINSVLKILEQEELITYSDQFFQPSFVEFTIDKQRLNDLEKSHPQYNEVVKGLLRSYDGIFDFPA
ncbi:MAG: ATP-dependent DNA helicase RecQ, partial [Ginsengibacter sp.]